MTGYDEAEKSGRRPTQGLGPRLPCGAGILFYGAPETRTFLTPSASRNLPHENAIMFPIRSLASVEGVWSATLTQLGLFCYMEKEKNIWRYGIEPP